MTRVLMFISLLLNAVIIVALVFIVISGRQISADIIKQLEDFGKQSISYKFRITQTVPVQALVPFNQSMVIPYKQVLPVNTTVTITKELPVIGQVSFDIPIQTNIPVSLSIPIDISQTIPVNAEVPLNMEIPLEIPIKDTPLKTMLDGIANTLRQISGR